MTPTQLTPHWTLNELLVTDHRQYLEEVQNPSDQVKANLKSLADNLLEKISELNQGSLIHANSGYRSPDLNHVVGGATNSQHMCGVTTGIEEAAADLIDFKNGNWHLFDLIRNSDLEFDQLITECPDINGNPAWVHVSWRKGSARRQVLKAIIVGKHPDTGAPIFDYKQL